MTPLIELLEAFSIGVGIGTGIMLTIVGWFIIISLIVHTVGEWVNK